MTVLLPDGCSELHQRLAQLHRVLGIEPQVHCWPLPPDNAYGAAHALACWEFARHFSEGSMVLVGDDPVVLYREMERLCLREMEAFVRRAERQADDVAKGISFLLRAGG